MLGTVNRYKLQVTCKSKRKLSIMFRCKYRVLYDLMSCVIYEYTCRRCNCSYYRETEKDLKVRFSVHIVISPLTFK